MKEKFLREIPEKRERYVKHFQMEQKGMAAAVYPSPVHYEENGEWKDIDNRLEAVTEDGKEVYRNKASAVTVRFASCIDAEELVSVEKDGHKISWNVEMPEMENTHTVNMKDSTKGFQALSKENFWKGPEELKKAALPNLVSEGMYEDILPDIDIHYTVSGESVKENIRLNTKEAAERPVIFIIRHPGLKVKKEDDGSIGFYSKAEESELIFEFIRPYMYDANGAYCHNVTFELEAGEEESKMKVVTDKEWLLAEDRVYPVVIDPMTETSKTKANIEDTYILTGGTDTTEDPSKVYAYGSFMVGKSDASGKMRALLRFKDLPDIGKGSIIYAATMYVWQYQYSTYGIAKLPIIAQEIKGSWDEQSVRWSNQPSVDSNILDYKEVAQVTSGSTVTITPIGFDVTKLVRKWYNTGNNYGIMLRSKYEDDTTAANKAYARFYSSDHPQMSSDQYPSGMFYYRNVNGLEDYQSYHEQSAGRAGTGYTNDFTGNLVWIHPDVQTVGGPLPVAVKHVYNSSEAATETRLGYGWRLSYMQKLTATGITDYPYVYEDEDGTKHYFYKDTDDGNKMKDEDGLGLTITSTTYVDYDHALVMETKDKMKYTFGKDGFLRYVEDPDGNVLSYEYEPNSTENYVDYIIDPTGNRLDITYKDDAAMSRITELKDSIGRITKYTYDSNGDLVTITYPDGKTSNFTYDSAHKLLSVTNPDGYKVSYEYVSDFRVPRVSRISETGSNGETGQELKITYENGNTTIFEEPGLDGTISETADNKKITYHFDNMGRPTDVQDSDGYANAYSYYSSGMKNHKLSKEGAMQKSVCGLLSNQLFDTAFSTTCWYTLCLSDASKGTITTDSGYEGTKSAKLVKTNTTSEEGICQDVTLDAGTYTLSAYVKTENMSGAEENGAQLMIIRADGTKISGSRMIDYNTDTEVDNGWERLMLTFELSEAETVTAFVGICGMSGTLWASGVQLEEGAIANRLNLVRNAGFEHCTSGTPDDWEYKAAATGVKTVTTSDKGICAALNGQMDQSLYICQKVNVSGVEGDIYHLGCWVKGTGIAGKGFKVSAAVLYDNADTVWHHFDCNPNIEGWQYVCGTFSTSTGLDTSEKTYKAIHIYLYYDNQVNQVLYKNVQLIRDDGESYVYNDDGNMISATSAAENSGFSYDSKGLVTRLGKVDGTAFEYGIDTENHMVNATNTEGVRYRFEYNDAGQPTKMTVDGGKHLGAVTPGRTYFIRDKYSGNYLEARDAGTVKNTVVQLHSFTGNDEQKWKAVACKDGYFNFEPVHAPGLCLDLANNNTSDGGVIQLYTRNLSEAQRWKLHPNKDGSYRICSKGNAEKKGLTNNPKSIEDGQAVECYTLVDGYVQQDWYFDPADEGTVSAVPEDGKIYYLRVHQSSQYLDVDKMATAEGSRTMQYYYNYYPTLYNKLFYPISCRLKEVPA